MNKPYAFEKEDRKKLVAVWVNVIFIMLGILCVVTHITTALFGSEKKEVKPVVKPTAIAKKIKPVLSTTNFKSTSRSAPEVSIKDKTIIAINKFLKNKLENKGSVIYKACKSQDPPVNCKLMTAIILTEVGIECNSSILNRACNVGGLNWYKGCGYPKNGWYMDFSKHGGVDTSIKVKARILSKYYIKQGRTNIVSIGLKYAPLKDSRNGIGGMNNAQWPKNVKYWYDLIRLNSQK